jgi:hypothetical protein
VKSVGSCEVISRSEWCVYDYSGVIGTVYLWWLCEVISQPYFLVWGRVK